MFGISGHQEENVTLLDVTEQICSHQMKMDGSGLDLVLKSVSILTARMNAIHEWL